MGTPLEPNEPGTACPLCWGPGKPFGDGETPRMMQLKFVSLEPGEYWIDDDEELLLMPHLLVDSGWACQWGLDFGSYNASLVWGPSMTIITCVNTVTGKNVFYHQAGNPCEQVYANQNTIATNKQAFNGYVEIDWESEGL